MQTRTRYEQAARQAVACLAERLDEEGSYGPGADDLACHYKSPQLYATAGRPRDAIRVLEHIRQRFMRPDGDFTTAGATKSANAVFDDFRAYPNGWIAMAAHRLGRFRLASHAMRHLAGYYDPDSGGFRTNLASGTDALTTAHLGLACLYTGGTERALAAGRYLARLLDDQPDLDVGFYLRLDPNGGPVTEFAAEAAPLYVVSAKEPDQAYFMVGYPIAFLTLLAEATGDSAHLEAARGYLDFVLACTGNVRSCHFAHKVAWGAALFARATDDRQAAGLARDIADHLVQTQTADGRWLPGEPAYVSDDQTAEVAIWLLEIDARQPLAQP